MLAAVASRHAVSVRTTPASECHQSDASFLQLTAVATAEARASAEATTFLG